MARLFVVPTPIGNLEDITLRALTVLQSVRLILAEDTRHTRALLTHHAVATPLRSYHQHNKLTRLDSILRMLETDDLALVSNAGMPAISDPGFELIRAAYAAGVEVDVLPGPSAVITAVVAAALPSPGFIFLGFLPRKRGDRRRKLEEVAKLAYTIVLFEAPHRMLAMLADLQDVVGNRDIVLARELTKVHQEIVRGSVSEIRQRYRNVEPRGEFTVVVAPDQEISALPLDDARDDLRRRRAQGEDARAAVSAVVNLYGLSRNQTYRLWLETG